MPDVFCDWIDYLAIIGSSVFFKAVPVFLASIPGLIVAFVAFHLNRKKEEKARKESELKVGAADADAGYLKLLQWGDIIGDILHHFKVHVANVPEQLKGDPVSLAIQPFLGALPTPERLRGAEYKFLLSMKEHAPLIAKVILIERRTLNLIHLVQKHASMRADLNAWQVAVAADLKMEGGTSKAAISSKHRGEYDLQVSLLEDVMRRIMSNEGLLSYAFETTNQFAAAAEEAFGHHFLHLKLTLREPGTAE